MNDDGLPRSLTVGAWPVNDGTLDNTVSNLVWGGTDPDAPEVVRARGLRERGWMVSREHPERQLGVLGWPPQKLGSTSLSPTTTSAPSSASSLTTDEDRFGF